MSKSTATKREKATGKQPTGNGDRQQPLTEAQRLEHLLATTVPSVDGVPLDLLAAVAYRRYGVAVVSDRAVPDVRDGLKPVQRRVLYDMFGDLKLLSSGPHKKSARVVGDVLGKYHPHGDQSVYDAMARMAQDFSMRLPLVDGQGNFGSPDGDSPAAMRYTEVRLSPAGEAMLADIQSDTVDWTPNFDNSLQEPVVVPAMIPNLLVNGCSGIAVGMATSIPPHNLGEVCEAVVFVAQNWARRDGITVDELMKHIPGPDFPTGGIVFRYRPDGDGEPQDVIREAYETGRSVLVVAGETDIQDIGGGKSEITITSVPYTVARSTIKDRIAGKKDDFRGAGVSNVTDLSDRTGTRLVIETIRGADPNEVLAYLLGKTALQISTSYIATVLVPGEDGAMRRPRQCGLRELLVEFVRFRLEVIVRRSRYELERAEARLHIVRGLLKAIGAIDEVIQIIRRSQSIDTARSNLMKRLKIDEVQANAILEMQLRRLARLEKRRLGDERKQLEAQIKELRGILASEKRQLEIVVQETNLVNERFATPRLTRIIEAEQGHKAAVVGPVAVEEPQVVLLTDGAVECKPAGEYRDRTRPGQLTARKVAQTLQSVTAEPETTMLLVSDQGKVWWGSLARLAGGVPSENGSRIIRVGTAESGKCLVLGTQAGKVKLTRTEDVISQAEGTWNTGIGLFKGDSVVFAGVASDKAHILMVAGGATGDARALRFEVSKVSLQATPSAKGVAGIKLLKGDQVIAGVVVEEETGSLLVLSEKRLRNVPLGEFPVQGRAGKGVALKVTASTGPVVDCALPGPGDANVDIYLDSGQRLRLELKEVGLHKRTQIGTELAGEYGFGDSVASAVACLS